METNNQDDRLVYTPMETAKILRIGRQTVYAQIRLKIIPSIHLGRKILVPRAGLMKMLANASGGGAGQDPGKESMS